MVQGPLSLATQAFEPATTFGNIPASLIQLLIMASLTAVGDTAPLVAADPIPAIVAAPIEVDDNADTDSTFESEIGSNLNYGSITCKQPLDFVSLLDVILTYSASIYNYRQENGRTYHAYSDGKYQLPNDENEQVRMDIAYHAILVMFEGKPFFAPVKNPQRILDMGTGTGDIWKFR